jgi:transcriptional antiterminator NusG
MINENDQIEAGENQNAPVEAAASTEASAPAAEKKPAKKKAKKAADGPLNDTSNIKEGMEWYVVHVYSGFEQKARMTLMERVKSHKMEDQFGGALVPQEQVVEMVKGQKKTSTKKFYPGYMIVQMNMNRDTWHLVKETPKVTGFVGDETSPDALTKEEVERLLKQVQEGAAAPRASMTFHQGESVKVIDGPFLDFNGTVEEVRPEKGKLRVLISIFGRATPVELDFAQVERLS